MWNIPTEKKTNQIWFTQFFDSNNKWHYKEMRFKVKLHNLWGLYSLSI